MPFFKGPVDTFGMIPTRLAIILLSSTEGVKNWMGARWVLGGLLDTPAEEAYERRWQRRCGRK
jgi:hypothetical protein